ncbi:MAG: dihydrofolate reductase family protein [Saprospiraceae bacterium]|nr:dihydrofolate reductase family protein [Saprospiraceae bacterium]
MGKLILETQISIDGFIADKNGGTNWMIWNWGPNWTWDLKLQNYIIELNQSANAIIISSQMAQEGFNFHWQNVSENANDKMLALAKHITSTPKYVASNSLTKKSTIPGGWENTQILKGKLKDSVSSLKKTIDGNIIVYGGATLVSNLINDDLIDEYYLVINPVALGNGLPIFRALKQLNPIRTITFECGVVVAQYNK